MRSQLLASLLFCVVGIQSCAVSKPMAPRGETLWMESFDGLALAYDDRDTVESNTTLLFIHGLCCERGFWAEQAERFSGEYRVITVDLAGHGESGVDRSSWTLPDMTRDVVALVRGLDLSRVIFVGHSMGGPVAIMAAAELPNRIEAVVAVDALHDPELRIALETFQPYLDAMALDYAKFWAQSVEGTFLPDADQAVMNRVLATANATPLEVAAGLMTSFPEFDLARTLALCPVPVRCINSAMSPTKLEAAQAVARDFDAIILEDVGHFLMLEAPDRFERSLRQTLQQLLN
ncbi:MAG: sigma-B regulation protein RsbQ [Planctomycetota bacterium]|jgi:sigma-B regulation protein RsbQ